MPVSPHLLRKLHEALGADAAEDLVNILESMDPLRGDLAELRHEMRLGFARMEQMEAKWLARADAMEATWVGRHDAGQARLEGLIEKSLREQTRFFFLAWSVLLAAIVGLYAR